MLGALDPPLCMGRGKAERACSWTRTNGVHLSASHFYAESTSDLPMLEIVGHPVVASADAKLRVIARRRA